MLDKIKKLLPKFPEKTKDGNNKDPVDEYRAFGELHTFIEKSVIRGLYFLQNKIKELNSFMYS